MPREEHEKKIVQVVVSPEISGEQIRDLVVRAGGIFGGGDCRGCGLVGVDLRLTGQDPENDLSDGALSVVVS
jgi:hypothetical protein